MRAAVLRRRIGGNAERNLEGIKAKLSAPAVMREVTKRVQSKLRHQAQPDKVAIGAELARVDAQIENVVDSLTAIGRSSALTDRLAALERQRLDLKAKLEDLHPSMNDALAYRWKRLHALLRDAINGRVRTAGGRGHETHRRWQTNGPF